MSSTRKHQPKTQPRPWRRPRNLVLAMTLLACAFVGWALFESWPVYIAKASPTVDYRAAMHERTLVVAGVERDDGADAWIRLRGVLELFEEVDEEIAARLLVEGFEPRDKWDYGALDHGRVLEGLTIRPDAERERQGIRRFYERGVFDRLAEYAAGPIAVAPPEPNNTMPVFALDIELGRLRHLAKAGAAAMRIGFVEGDMDRLVAAFDGVLALGQAAAHRPGMTGMLTGMAIHALAIWEIRRELIERQFDEAVCDRLLEVLDRQALPPIELAIESERHFVLDHVQWMYSDDDTGDGYLLPDLGGYDPASLGPPDGTLLDAVASRFVHSTRAETVAAANAVFDDALAVARTGVTPTDLTFIEARLDATEHFLLRLLLPSLDKAIRQDRMQRSITESVRLMLALEIHHARHGVFPPALNDLAPAILETVPLDAVHGGPYGYKLLTGDPFGREYLLYSYGFDATDDGGRAFLGHEIRAYSADAPPGIDAILNLPRQAIDE